MLTQRFLLCFLLLIATPLLAQEETDFRHVREMGSNAITCMVQQENDNLWAGTTNGLVRYNGLHAETFSAESTKSTRKLLDSHITALHYDALKNIWVGTPKGLHLLNPKLNKIAPVATEENKPASTFITQIQSDQQGNVWLGTPQGLMKYYPGSNQFEQIQPGGFPNAASIELLYRDRNNFLWIISQQKLFKYDPQQNVAKAIDLQQVHTISEDNAGQLWIAHGNAVSILKNPSASKQQYAWFHLANHPTLAKDLTTPVVSIAHGGYESVWLGTKNQGIVRFYFQDLEVDSTYKIAHYKHKPDYKYSLISDSITTLMKDKQNSMWIGTVKGMNKRNRLREEYGEIDRSLNNFFKNLREELDDDADSTATPPPAKEKQKAKAPTTGYIMYGPNSPVRNATLIALDEEGNVVAKTETNQEGSFTFKTLDADKNYIFKMEESDVALSPYAAIYITNDDGKAVKILRPNEDATFNYTTLNRQAVNSLGLMEEDDPSIVNIPLQGFIYSELKADQLSGFEVMVVNDEGEVLFTALTDERGQFTFTELPPDRNYSLKVRGLEDATITIIDEQGNTTSKLVQNKNGTFLYERLKADELTISLIDENDRTLYVRPSDIFRNNQIFYAYNSSDLNDLAKKELTKLAQVLKANSQLSIELSSHTDARGSESFNQSLSQKRMEVVIKFMKSQGISKQQIRGQGFGESQPLVPCAEVASCKESDHAKNRRTEFKFVAKG